MISHGPAGSIALDIGANVGAYSLLAGALGKKVLAVEMQPGCIDQIRCHSSQLNHPNLVRILSRFVAATKQHAPVVRVPRAECTTMASPSAVVGRWPHGLLTKATRMLNKKAPTIIENTTLLVQPVHLATYIERHFPRVHSILAKIDTEGFEIQVLESTCAPCGHWPTLLCWSFNLMLGDLLM